jgi:hypothetical protein
MSAAGLGLEQLVIPALLLMVLILLAGKLHLWQDLENYARFWGPSSLLSNGYKGLFP